MSLGPRVLRQAQDERRNVLISRTKRPWIANCPGIFKANTHQTLLNTLQGTSDPELVRLLQFPIKHNVTSGRDGIPSKHRIRACWEYHLARSLELRQRKDQSNTLAEQIVLLDRQSQVLNDQGRLLEAITVGAVPVNISGTEHASEARAVLVQEPGSSRAFLG